MSKQAKAKAGKGVPMVEHAWRVALMHTTQEGKGEGVQGVWVCEVSAATVRRATKAARLAAHKAKLPGRVGAMVGAVREDGPCWPMFAPTPASE